MEINKIYNEDCLEGLRKLPDGCVDCCVTSPPYWGLRDYGENGQLGLEATPQLYIERLVEIFSEVQRVLKPTGTCFVNLGDTYSSNLRGNRNGIDNTTWASAKSERKRSEKIGTKPMRGKPKDLKNKCLCLIPERFAIEICANGWILRNTIIWHKPNQMPSSAKDRFTVDFEKLFFFVKQPKYYFEQQHEPHKEISLKRWPKGGEDTENTKYKKDRPDMGVGNLRNGSNPLNEEGRNRRCVWSMNTKPFSDAHFACYPEKLIEIPIKAGCPEFICKKCGKARKKIVKAENQTRTKKIGTGQDSYEETKGRAGELKRVEIGLTDCGCNAGWQPGIVLDIFMGSGTTACVARKLGRNYIGYELNADYIEIAEKRIYNELGMFS